MTHIIAAAQTMIISAPQQGSVKLCHIVCSIVVPVNIIQPICGAVHSISAKKVQLEPLLHLARGAARAGASLHSDGGHRGNGWRKVAHVVVITIGSLTILIVAAS